MDYSQFSTDDLKAMQAGDLSKVSSAALKQLQTEAQPKTTAAKVVDSANAVGTGYFKGLVGGLAGLPVDTIANVIDLGKAALGAPYTAITGKPAPEALQVGDRKDVVGSGAYLLDKARQTAIGRNFTQAANPEYENGFLQAAGGAMNGVMRPVSVGQGVNQAVNSVAGTTLGKVVGDATGSPALAIAASLSPTAAQSAGTGALKYMVRGNEAGRQAMAQRIQDLKQAGVDNPTVGLASGNPVVGGVENILQNTPGAVKIMRNSRDAAVGGMQAKADAAAELASPNRGSLESGVAIQDGIKSFKDAFKDKQAQLYDELGRVVTPQHSTDIRQTRETLARLNEDIPGAPALSKFFKNGKIQALEAALDADTAGTPPGPMRAPQPPISGGGLMNPPVEVPPVVTMSPPGSNSNVLPFEAVKKVRTLVGNEIADNSLISTVPRSKWNALYGALSDDMGVTAARAGPDAQKAFDRATDYTRAGMERLDRVAPFANRDAPEQSFQLLNRTLGDNVSTLQAVKKSLPEGARGTIAGTVIEKLGTARPGVQNDTGTGWSPDTFLTNWNKMKPEARAELLSGFPNSAQVLEDVSAVAKAASMMRDSSKMWANPSGTSANLAARGTLAAVAGGGAGAAAGIMNPIIPIAAAGGLVGTNLLARGLTSAKNVNSIASKSYIDPRMQAAQLNVLANLPLNQREK